MLEPRETELLGLLCVLVFCPLVVYFCLGQWKDVLEKKERIKVLAQLASEEAFRVDNSPPSPDTYVGGSSCKNGNQKCAQCFRPATTRCSRCKTVRYCSGKCQIVHWRKVHKDECQYLDTYSPSGGSGSGLLSHRTRVFRPNPNHGLLSEGGHSDTGPLQMPSAERISFDNYEDAKVKNGPPCPSIQSNSMDEAASVSKASSRTMVNDPPNLVMRKQEANSPAEFAYKQTSSEGSIPDIPETSYSGQEDAETSYFNSSSFLKRSSSHSLSSKKNGWSACEKKVESTSDCIDPNRESLNSMKDDPVFSPASSKVLNRARSKTEVASSVQEARSRKHSVPEVRSPSMVDSRVSKTTSTAGPQHSSGISNRKEVNAGTPWKPLKVSKQSLADDKNDSLKMTRMLFPYEDFVCYFHCEGLDLPPRGLLNCGNSCYANAILQCLTYTKPLIVYLLQRCHSGTCCVKDWCLMCELEQHAMKMTEGSGPLSPVGILSHLQKNEGRMGSGSQEDAHEFLRLIITSMQSISLAGLGGEKNVDIRLQETTFIHQTFGGCLRSKVKCLRCLHESERYENIMDLTLEILGWVESLENALAQFTSPEDLDGENKYRCSRCLTYVKARKQLNIHEAPNILTIALKRFQTGKYGKITKCITFPDVLDMSPYMTGTGDAPPLYLLYGVVVHLDSQNASFSGHYVSYVKDLHGAWFQIDDIQVEPVPTSQVMSEGAYVLFYSRSSPRPPRSYSAKAHLAHSSAKKPLQHSHLQKAQAPCSRSNPKAGKVPNVAGDDHHLLNVANRKLPSKKATHLNSTAIDYSDLTSSEGSIFTSSDDASFTTESDRYSTSTTSEADAHANNSFLESLPRATSCKLFSPCRLQTRFFSENNGYVVDSSLSAGNVNTGGRHPEQASASSLNDPLKNGNHCSMSLRHKRDSFFHIQDYCGL